MTLMPCHCSNPRCLPLCALCRACQQIVPLIRRQLKTSARRYGWVLAREDVEDLIQQVLSELARSSSFERLSCLAVCIARRRLIDWIRHSAARCRREPQGNGADERTARPEGSDLALDVMAAMDRMSSDMRRVFFACGIERCTREEAVDRLGLSPAAVRKLYAGAVRIATAVLGIDTSGGSSSPRARKPAGDDIHL